MEELAKKFSITELQSILIHIHGGSSIAQLIDAIQDPCSTLINPAYKRKFNSMLPRLHGVTAAEEQILRLFSERIQEDEMLAALRHLYTDAQ